MPRSKTLLILLIHHHMPLLLHDLIDAPRLYRSQVSYMHIPDRTCLHNLECILSSQNVTNKAMDHLYYYPHLSGINIESYDFFQPWHHFQMVPYKPPSPPLHMK